MLSGKIKPHRLKLTAEFSPKDEPRLKTTATWRYDEKGILKLDDWTSPNMKTTTPPITPSPNRFYHNPVEMERLKWIPVSEYPMSKRLRSGPVKLPPTRIR